MPSPIGLLLVHGIGNQRPDVLALEVATRLSDSKSQTKGAFHPTFFSWLKDWLKGLGLSPTGRQSSRNNKKEVPIHRITVHGVPVHVREANWAALSHPDNPPRVRLAYYIWRDFVGTVSSALYLSGIASALRSIGRPGSARRSLIVWVMLALVLSVAFLLPFIAQLDPNVSATPEQEQFGLLHGLLGALMGILVLYLTGRKLRQRALAWGSIGRIHYLSRLLVWLPIAYFAAWVQFFLVLLSAELLLFFSVVVLLALAFDYLAIVPVLILQAVGWLLGKLRLKAIRRWVHRLGWVMVVLPVHSLLQTVKAAGNLISVVFTERRASVRWAAATGLLGVYAYLLVLLVPSEFLFLLPFATLLMVSEMGGYELLAFYLIVGPVYLVFIKLSLPAIDLLLDIGNYHLASDRDRSDYYGPIEQAVASLQQSGCREIHVLAHSLGSVIIYDWLRSIPAKTCPFAVLHTIGSPLDKFWYLDHPRPKRLTDTGGLADHLSRSWTNYWAYSDPISGSLDHFSAPALRVSNRRLRWLGPALLGHVYYWKNSVVIDEIRNEIATSVA